MGYIRNISRRQCAVPVGMNLKPVPLSKKLTSKSAPNAIRFFTGKQKLVDSAGRVERFKRKYAKFNKASTDTKTEATTAD